MLFDIKRVKENKIRSRETRSSNFLLKRVFSDMESRILDLPDAWEYGLIEGCRGTDLKELNKNNKVIISEPKLSLTVPGSLINTSLDEPKLAT